MTRPCGDVHAFADGELDAEAHERFAAHLGECNECGRELEHILTLGALADEARSVRDRPLLAGPAGAARRRPQTRRLGQVAVAVLAMAAGILLLVLPGKNSTGPGTAPGEAGDNALLVALSGKTHRQLDGRLAYPGMDQHRHLNNQRAGGVEDGPVAPPAGLAVEEGLAQLEARNDLHGLGVAHLLLGNLPRARDYLEQAAPSTAVLNDRSTLALRQGKHAEALALAEQALARDPGQPQALWNRALALDGLRRSPQAADAFDRAAAASGNSGWTAEARDRARRLRLGPAGSPRE